MSTDPVTSTPPTDSSPYIRTYAKDLASVTGQEAVLPSNKKDSKKDRFVRPDEALVVSEAPSATPADLSQLESEAERMSGGARPETEADIEMRIREGKDAPASDVLQTINLPRLHPGDIIQQQPFSMSTGAPAPLSQETPEEREAILARLRAKVAQEPTETPAPAPEAPAIPEPLSSAAFVPQMEPPTNPTSPDKAAPFHSYSTDFADRIDEQHASAFAVLGAENEVRAKPVVQKKKRGLLPIIAGGILILVGLGAAGAAYHFLLQNTPVVALPMTPEIVTTDAKVSISGGGPTLMAALAGVANQPTTSGEVIMTYINEATTTKEGVEEAPGTGGDLITALDLPAPDILIRNIDPSSMVGVVNDGSQTAPFFALRVLSYERTFAGMLEWEPTIGNDLSVLYPPYPAPVTAASTTASSTAPVYAPQYVPSFIDEVVDNHNARALKDAHGNTLIIYGYADPQTLIIARDEKAFTLLISRLQSN
jgi:hypothetical protein